MPVKGWRKEPPQSRFFVFDVESIGLHGEGFAVGGGLYGSKGVAQWEFRFCCPIDACEGDAVGRAWVKANVPKMEETHRLPKTLRADFWRRWIEAKGTGAMMVADCLWPVEAGFVARCIHDDFEKRAAQGPYPFLDVGSFLLSAGLDPTGYHGRTREERPVHDPLRDARQSARLLFEALNKTPLNIALEESVKLQTHYAKLLNGYDGGGRIGFKNAAAWIDRLRATGTLPGQ